MSTKGPAVQRLLSGDEQSVSIPEAPRWITTKHFASPEIRHEEIGHVMAGGGLRGGRKRAQRDDPVLAQDRDKLLHLGVRSTELAAAVCLSII